jgi:hypothetical protein
VTTCEENNTIRKKKEIFNEVWEKSAVWTLPNQTVRGFSHADAKILSTLVFC